MDDPYAPVIESLRQQSVNSYFQTVEQLVVSRQRGPARPFAGNSFWITHHDGSWYVCTWVPICYRVPSQMDVVALCVEFVDRGKCAQYDIPNDLIQRYDLFRLSDQEATDLFG
jgi:hypothetical protein